MKKTFVVTNKHIVRAPNIGEAKNIVFTGEGHGDVLGETSSIEEISEEEVIEYINEKDSMYVQSSNIEIKEEYEAETEDLLSSISDSRNDFLRSENKKLAKRVETLKNVQEEVVRAVYEAAYDAFSSFEFPKVKAPNLKRNKEKLPETAVAVFADWQMGKITPDYNTNVLEERIERYTEKLLEITEIQRMDHEVNDLHIWLLGDIVEGEEIFPGQSHLIDSGLYRQVAINGPRILGNFVKVALENFNHVHVTGVIGNHGAVGGRARKQHDPETNMDRMLYKIIELIVGDEERISFNIPDGRGERNWYAIDTIGNYSSLLIHGDQLPSPSAFHGYYKKIMGWKDGAIPEHFDDVFMGHYHQQFKVTIGSSMLRISGSPESYNTYAQEYFSSMSRPCQHLMFVHPENGVTSEYSVWLD
jgi:hypothetical protein